MTFTFPDFSPTFYQIFVAPPADQSYSTNFTETLVTANTTSAKYSRWTSTRLHCTSENIGLHRRDCLQSKVGTDSFDDVRLLRAGLDLKSLGTLAQYWQRQLAELNARTKHSSNTSSCTTVKMSQTKQIWALMLLCNFMNKVYTRYTLYKCGLLHTAVTMLPKGIGLVCWCLTTLSAQIGYTVSWTYEIYIV